MNCIKKRSGRRTILDPVKQTRLKEDILTHPRQLGYKFSNWNAVNAQHHISVKFGESVSIRTVNRIFHHNHLTLLRPRTMPAKGNEIQQQTFFDDLRNQIQQAGPNEQFFFFDAASVHRSTSVTRVWAEKGPQPEIKCCGGRERIHILGFLNFTSSQAPPTQAEVNRMGGFVSTDQKKIKLWIKNCDLIN